MTSLLVDSLAVTRPAVETLLSRLAHKFGERLRTDPEALEGVAGDESGLPGCSPAAVIWPRSSEDVAHIAREAAELGVGLVPRGSGTGKAGACIPRPADVVVDFSRMNQILEMRPKDMYAVVQPGVITGDFHAAAADIGFFYPPDPGSWESCSLGGNISTNAGGTRAAKYGSTQRYVWGLEVVLAGGEVLRMGKRSIKGVAGYDLTSLLVGSEGTLGFVTEATMHIIVAPAAVETAWLSFPNMQVASRAAEKIFSAGFVPRVMEIIDKEGLDAVRSVSDLVIEDGVGAALLVELDGPQETTFDGLIRLCEIAVNAGASDSALARKEKDREAMRRTRRLVSTRLKEQFPFKNADDIAVPRSRMAELLDRARELCRDARFCAYGHLGDGNLHVNLLCKTAQELEAAQPLRRKILELTVSMGGTITGEHGIGLAKRDVLDIEQSQELIALQRRIKATLDPYGIMNPGKVFPNNSNHG